MAFLVEAVDSWRRIIEAARRFSQAKPKYPQPEKSASRSVNVKKPAQ